MAIAPKSKATNSMPSWVSAPDPGGAYFQVLTEMTNPTTGET